jgi:hypothetical protein
MNFEEWKKEVNRLCDSFGLPYDAIEDVDWEEFFDDEQTPYSAVKLAFSD